VKRLIILLLFVFVILEAKDTNSTEQNSTSIEKHLQEQIKREQKYAKEQKFYKGDEYDLNAHKVDKKLIEKVPVIEPEYDFDMSEGVYSD